MAAAAGPLAGIEVPLLGSDKIQWVEITVPSSTSPSPPLSITGADADADADTSRDAAGCYVVPGDPKAYFIWRLHKNLPNVLEIVELFACKELPQIGLRLAFMDSLFPFCFLCKNETPNGAENAYSLYVLTISGVAYLLSLKTPLSYISGSAFPQSDLVEFNVRNHAQSAKVNAVVASPGCLLTGRQDGSICCYQLGKLDPTSPGFFHELRDDAGIGRLWSIMSRGKVVGSVKDMAMSELYGRKFLFVLHVDGHLRVWDLVRRTRVTSQMICSHEFGGSQPSRLWVSEANNDTNLVSLAILHGDALLSSAKVVSIHHFDFNAEDKLLLSSGSLSHSIHLEGKVVDIKLNIDKLWVLGEEGTVLYDLSYSQNNMNHKLSYISQENFVADQLFQSPYHPFDDLALTNNFLFSSTKDQAAYFFSSVLLRRLLQPGVHQNGALRATLLEHKKYISDSELQTLTMAGLEKEIFSIIKSEGAAMNSGATICYWKKFYSSYFQHWCQNCMPYGLLVDSSLDLVGLIRRSSVSFFRPLEARERLVYDFSEEIRDIEGFRMTLADNGIDCKLFLKLLRCIELIMIQYGRASVALFYESLINPVISSDHIVHQLLKMMETGYAPFEPPLAWEAGYETTLQNKQTIHRRQRKFAVDMLHFLDSLCSEDVGLAEVLDLIENYLKFLSPHKSTQASVVKGLYNVNSSILIEATSQVAGATFEVTYGILLILGYLINAGVQVCIMQTDISRIRLQLIPMAHEIVTQWLTIHFLGTTPTTRPTLEDFSSRLSLLHIGKKTDKKSCDGKLGSSSFTLACLLDLPLCSGGKDFLLSTSLPNPSKLMHSVQEFCSLIACGKDEKELLSSSPAIELASLLLNYGQYEATENLFTILNKYTQSKRVPLSSQTTDGDRPARFHLLGFCLLVRAQSELQAFKEQKLREAIRCFFSAASADGAPQALQNLSFNTGFQPPDNYGSAAVWKLHYYQWVMQIFEQYGVNEGACQFALAALEQVDIIEADSGNLDLPETATIIRGRLWANVFKFNLDLKHYRDAYCAIISNPDEDSKYICLRRFIIVLCEHGALKVLCDVKLPFVGLIEKVEQELVWKAERSDICSKPNMYKLLYAFEASQNNWRKAASYMYRYSERLKNKVMLDGSSQVSLALQERLHALSSAMNALQLVDHAYAWIDPRPESSNDRGSPNKRPRNSLLQSSIGAAPGLPMQYCIDFEMLEKEYIIASAHYTLYSLDDNFKLSGRQSHENIVDVLIQENLYDTAFTIIIKFWKGSGLKSELERAFVAISQKCCPSRIGSSSSPSSLKKDNLQLTFYEEDPNSNSKDNTAPPIYHIKGSGNWEALEIYLAKYKELHHRLPVIVAETLLYTDPLIELPLWLVHMFKGGRRATSWGMTGREPDPATLFRLYIDYGRHAEASNLLLEYLESFAALRPVDIKNRKKMSAVWFPYTAIDRLWCQLEELRNSGHMVDQCDRLRKMLQEALMNNLKMVEVDSRDVLDSAYQSEVNNINS